MLNALSDMTILAGAGISIRPASASDLKALVALERLKNFLCSRSGLLALSDERLGFAQLKGSDYCPRFIMAVRQSHVA